MLSVKDSIKRNRPKMESLVLSSTSANQNLIPDLTIVSASPRNVMFNQSIWNFMLNTRELIAW